MRVTGTVKFFNHSKGYGFVAPEDGSKDVFVHATAVERAGIGSMAHTESIKPGGLPGVTGLAKVRIGQSEVPARVSEYMRRAGPPLLVSQIESTSPLPSMWRSAR